MHQQFLIPLPCYLVVQLPYGYKAGPGFDTQSCYKKHRLDSDNSDVRSVNTSKLHSICNFEFGEARTKMMHQTDQFHDISKRFVERGKI